MGNVGKFPGEVEGRNPGGLVSVEDLGGDHAAIWLRPISASALTVASRNAATIAGPSSPLRFSRVTRVPPGPEGPLGHLASLDSPTLACCRPGPAGGLLDRLDGLGPGHALGHDGGGRRGLVGGVVGLGQVVGDVGLDRARYRPIPGSPAARLRPEACPGRAQVLVVRIENPGGALSRTDGPN